MKNEDQIKKDLVSEKSVPNPVKFITFKDDEEYQTLKGVIRQIH